jgi:hypothetical protein
MNPLIRYIRSNIDSLMFCARHLNGTARRNAVHEARAWNKLLVRELRNSTNYAESYRAFKLALLGGADADAGVVVRARP